MSGQFFSVFNEQFSVYLVVSHKLNALKSGNTVCVSPVNCLRKINEYPLWSFKSTKLKKLFEVLRESRLFSYFWRLIKNDSKKENYDEGVTMAITFVQPEIFIKF